MRYNKSDHTKIKGRKEKRPPKKITAQYLHNSGLYYLERFAASKNHFKTVMSRKVKRSCHYHTDQDYDACITLVNELADKFERVGLLDDSVYTRGLVTSLRRRGHSKTAILNKMRIKGIASEQTLEALSRLDEDLHETQEEAERHAALKLARKKKIGPYFIGEEPDIKKALGMLARAGFSYDVAKYVLDLAPDDPELDRMIL